jgi:hypothetical protein
MSTLKVDSIENGGSAVNFTTNVQAGNSFPKREYYEQAYEPSGANNAAVWYDTTNNELKLKINGFWYGVTASAPMATGNRALVGGSSGTPGNNVIQYYDISSTGNAVDFGDLLGNLENAPACSSGSIAVWGGGRYGSGSFHNVIQFVTIGTLGNAADFGDLTVARQGLGAASNISRGLFAGGYDGSATVNTIDFITFPTANNATDFGNLDGTYTWLTGTANQVRALFNKSGSAPAEIDYVTIDTAGNAADFGNLTVARTTTVGAFSDDTRAVFGGGSNAGTGAKFNTIDYFTIATTGNATDFGDLTAAASGIGGCANATRGTFNGGVVPQSINTIQYVTIQTPGNATDFGDLLAGRGAPAACSGE